MTKTSAHGFRWRGFRRDRRGASALEFAILATPFFLLFLGLLDVALVYIGNFSLENAVSESARWIRTGQAQQWGEAGFKDRVCQNLMPPLTCDGIKLDVRTFDNFSGAELTNPFDSNGDIKEQFAYEPGERNDVVVVRAFYEWQILKEFPVAFGFGSDNRVLVATAAFRNEPF